MKTLCGFAAILLYTFSVLAWSDGDVGTLGQRIEQDGYRADADDLQVAHDLLKAKADSDPSGKYLYYYLGYADYTLAGVLATSDAGRATDMAEDAQAALLHALKLDPAFAEAEALLGASYGLEIGLHPFKGLWLGSKAQAHSARAWQLAPQDPRVIMLQAVSDFSTPSSFGGDRQRALQRFHAAVAAFDAFHDADPLAPAWGRAEAQEWLGYAESRSGDFAAARADLGKALQLEPGYKLAQRRLTALPAASSRAAAAGTL